MTTTPAASCPDRNARAAQLATFARDTPLTLAIERINAGTPADSTVALQLLASAAADIASAGHAVAQSIIAAIVGSRFPTATLLHLYPITGDELDGFTPAVLRDDVMQPLWVHRLNANWDLDDRPDWEQQLEAACASLTSTGTVPGTNITTEALR
ncbi:hypothetical protein [Curtobacterium citreum]|uniref:hypothetical protein n=1 Tax=Curtobacterium citreum TaxID=2036 RepID=UPI0025437399|nr:hypothetical protein [Curtobacterium citreum]WIJ45582.1 hypothetical protein QPK07_01080 [Curtobacterium citreum]